VPSGDGGMESLATYASETGFVSAEKHFIEVLVKEIPCHAVNLVIG
jgi:hypothetical protein